MSKEINFNSNPRKKREADLSALDAFVNKEAQAAAVAPAPTQVRERETVPYLVREENGREDVRATEAPKTKSPVKMKRLTIDVHPALHKRIKRKCLEMEVDMCDEIRRLLELHFPEESKS